MRIKTVDQALREAGLSGELANLIVENKIVAEALVLVAEQAHQKIQHSLMDTVGEACIPSRRKREPYQGRLDLSLIPNAVLAIRQRGKRISALAVARELGWNTNTFCMLVQRRPDVKALLYS